MKLILLIPSLLILFFNTAFSQSYENPYVESVGDRLCYITKVEFTKQYTIVSFEHLNNKSWIRLSKDIKINTTDDKSYHYIKSEGISIAPDVYNFKEGEEKHAFTVYFEPLPKSTKIFDVLEVEPGTKFDFNFYGVNIQKKRTSDTQIAHFKTTDVTDVVISAPYPNDFMANGLQEMFQSSMEASVNYFKQPKVMKEQAELRKAFYDALVTEGFTSEQAMQILISTSFK